MERYDEARAGAEEINALALRVKSTCFEGGCGCFAFVFEVFLLL